MLSIERIEELSPEERRRELARLLEAKRQREATYPLAPSQLNMWMELQLDAESSAYNMPLPFSITGELRADTVRHALQTIVDRHSVLRSVLIMEDDSPVQRVHRELEVALPVRQIQIPRDVDWRQEILRVAHEQAKQPFDLAAGPLFRFELLRLDAEHHVLLMTIHHIVMDGWSIGVLLKEFAELYLALAAGRPAPLAPLPVSFRDFVLHQRESQLASEESLSYWRERLSEAPSATDLPFDLPLPAIRSFRGSSCSFKVGADLVREITSVGRRLGLTTFTLLLGAYYLLLSKISGENDLVIGVSLANREREEYWGLLGSFANILPMRARVDEHSSVATFLEHLKASFLNDYERADVPLVRIIEALNPVRVPGRSTLLQVAFVYQNSPWPSVVGESVSLGGCVEFLNAENGSTKAELNLSISKVADELEGTLEYCSDLFSHAAIQRFCEWYVWLLEQMAASPAVGVSQLDLLRVEERRRADATHVSTAIAEVQHPSPAQAAHELIERQSAHAPERTALICGDREVSYRALDASANEIASALVGAGCRPNDTVGLLVGRSPEMIAGLLGISKAGCAYLPLDTGLPQARLETVVADAGARLLLTNESGRAAAWADSGVRVIALQSTSSTGAQAERSDVSCDLAYVLYTSGSTGRPKGVKVPHSALLNFVEWAAEAYALGPEDRVLQFASISFDASAEEIFPCLARGATLVLRDQEMIRSAAAFFRSCAAQGITVLDLPTAYWHELVNAMDAEHLELPASIRLVIIGGEAASVDKVRIWYRRVSPRVRLINTYGPTETTIVATACELSAADGARERISVPIGYPIRGTQVYVLDRHGRRAPPGIYGEIVIGGAGVSRGYVGRPELTAEKFVPDPFAAGTDAIVYLTGDIGRWLEDGRLEFKGRADRQVKVRGFRIELDEIELVLASHPAIEHAVVVLSEEGPQGSALVMAYAVLKAGAQQSSAAVRDWLGTRLPSYMIPTAVVFLNELPHTAGGKIDRRALKKLGADAASGERAAQSARTPTEALLVEIWREILGVSELGVHDSFFDLGGQSLLAIRMLSRVRQKLGVEIPPQRLFEKPTIAHFSNVIDSRIAEGALPPPQAISRVTHLSRNPDAPVDGGGELWPLSSAQQRIWFLAQLEERAGAAYHVPAGVRLLGELNVGALKRALARIVDRHEVLRTHFESADGVPSQLIGEAEGQFTLLERDLTLQAGAEQARDEEIHAEVMERFDLQRGPLIRGRLLRLGAQDHVLLVTMHHIVCDGWSMSVFVNELNQLYQAFSQGRPDPLAPLTIQYADYAIWQRDFLAGEACTQQIAFWLSHLNGAPPLLSLPTDRARPAVQDYAGASVGFSLDKQLSADLHALSRRHGTTLFMTLLAGWAALLSRLSGQQEVVVGTPVAGRTRTEVESLIGLFVNTLALRISVATDVTVQALLEQVRFLTLAAQSHQDVPFDQVVDALKPQRTLAHSPVFQVIFTWQNVPESALEFPGLKSLPVVPPQKTSQVDLSLDMWEGADGIVGMLTYASALFDAATIERWSGHWRTLLEALAASSPDLEVSQLSIEHDPTQRGFLEGAGRAQQIAFWLSHLNGAPSLLSLPTDRARPAAQDYVGASVEFSLDKRLSADLHALSRRHGATLFMTLLAGWAVLLSRLSGQQEVVVGTPVAGRSRTEVESLISLFVDTLALRIAVAADVTVQELLERARSLTLAAQSHQDVPFDQVMDALKPPRTQAHSPVFQAMFSWQDAPRELQTTTQVDLSLDMWEGAEGIAGRLTYASALFDAATIERWCGHWRTLLKELAASSPHTEVARLTLLTARERHQLLTEFNAAPSTPPPERLAHELFAEQVARTPDAAAVVFNGTTLSYSELNARANCLAHELIARGVGPDMRVGLAVSRGPELLVGILATLKAGGAYVPLDTDYPAERLRFMVRDSAPRLVLTQERYAHLWKELADNVPVITLDAPSPDWLRHPADCPLVSVRPGHLAYVIYTSGSTGTPKGAGVYHRGLSNLLSWYVESLELSASDSVLVLTSHSFDLTQKNLLSPLLIGGTVHLAAEVFDPDALCVAISRQNIRLINLPPSAFDALIDVATPGAFASLRYIVLGGEPINAARMARLGQQYPQLTLVNSYGPTECADVCAYHCIQMGSITPSTVIPIGRPIPHARLYVMDGRVDPVAIGVSGEIMVGGVGVGAGYLNSAPITADRFITDPYAGGDSDARLYKTGDVGRWRADGTIEYLGRNDQQVKIRGFRIELGEIETQLTSVSAIREAVVIAREDTPGNRRLVAYFTLEKTQAALTIEQLRAHLATRLPDYMLPAAYVEIETLPLTPNGKLDKRALPAPSSGAFGERLHEAPHGETETWLAKLWQELLGLERLSRHAHFFELGGHSLLAVRVISRLREQLGADVTVAQLFSHPTLADFAQQVQTAAKSMQAPIIRVDRKQFRVRRGTSLQ